MHKRSLLKFLVLTIICSNFLACTIANKRKSEFPVSSTGELPPRVAIPESGEGAEPPAIPDVKVPKIGIILGPGGARSYAYIGFLRELEKAKIPVHSIAGLEWGALMAALYSVNGKAHEVEWKASKIPEDFAKKGFLSSGYEPKAFSDIDNHLKTMFADTLVESGKIPFSCITDNLKTFKSLMVFKGAYRENLGFCMGLPPISTSKNSWVASALQTRYLIDQMAQRGVDYIVLVDTVTSAYPLTGVKVDESTAALWSNIHKTMNQNKIYVHQFVAIPIAKNILDFKSRKEFIQQGERTGKEAAAKIVQQFGL